MEAEDILLSAQQEKTPLEILKELTDKSKVSLFSELSNRETKLTTRILFINHLLNRRFNQKEGETIIELDKFIETFLIMRVNMNRKSREEFVESFKSERAHDSDNKFNNVMQRFIK
jgi:hypothetical protein